VTEVHHYHEHEDHEHEHGHSHATGLWDQIAAALHLPGHGHTHERPAASDAVFANESGIRTVKLAFIALGITTLLQVVIYLASGSVALLADTVHNLGDALNSLPLWIAFILMRRAANKRYTFGYGRSEDLAGVLIVVSIVFSAGYIFWESIQKLLNPQPLTNLGWVAAAALIGFIGNEAVAIMQLRVGRQIGSEAMVADGKHARTDGITSLAVLIAVVGTWLGYPIVDPIIGILIAITIVFIARDTAVAMWHRMMDAVDPVLVQKVEQVLDSHPEIKNVVRLQMRWMGHRLHANIIVALDGSFDLEEAEKIADHIRHHLLHDLPHLNDVMIAAVPWREGQVTGWAESVHHSTPQHA
jgi:cation diffusion facilitator family transporter